MGRHAQDPTSRPGDARPQPTARHRGGPAAAPTPAGRDAVSRPTAPRRPARGDDDAVAIAMLPPVPTAGTRPSTGTDVGGPVAQEERVLRRRARRAAADAAARDRTGTRRGGRLHGVLVYSLGLVLVLSSVYGVASNVGDGDNVVTDTASSFRELCFGDDTDEDETSSTEDSLAEETSDEEVVEDDAAEDDAVDEDAVEEDAAEEDAPDEEASDEVVEEDSASEEVATEESDEVVASPDAATVAGAVPAPAGAGAALSLPAGTWLSGASGDGVADGSFGAWRGSPVTIGGTWVDNNRAMVELWQIDEGGEFATWDQALDIAIGAISDDESWEQAAKGAYDDRWRTSLTNMKTLWGDRTAPLFIRFAHEMNGDWYPWSVDSGNKDAFVASWKHFRALQQEIFPAAKLVFPVNRESVGSGFDWRESFPGTQYADVIGVDYYNQYPTVESAADWADSLDDVDKYGAPKGLQAHLDFARSVGLPLAVPEWSGKAGNSDSPAFIQGMHDFFATNAGTGPGQFLYDVQFNIDMHDDAYRIYPTTRMPDSAEAYRRLF